MEASEVLRRYQAGERIFQRVSLRGQSFEGQNLEGVDFSEADLRSTNFTKTKLRKAKFAGAKCGLQKRWAAFLVVLSWLLAGISGLFSAFVSSLIPLILDGSSIENQISGWVSLLVLIIFLIVITRQGALVVVRAVALVVVVAGLGAVAGALAVALAGALVVVGAMALVVVGAIAVALALAGGYIGWRAMRGDARDAWVRSFAIAFAAVGGTSFRGADLTDANFAQAQLKSTDLREATLTRVRWHGTKMLDRVRPGDSYLKSTQIRQWLIGEEKEKDKNFAGQKLEGINLQGANLTDASFIDANLQDANLSEANLSRAKLVQTQLDGTNFTGATLTGAFIEGWGITSNTILDEVKCQYIFMRLPSIDNPEPCRKPDNCSEVFADGDFANFIKPIFDTLDLYHNQDVDPRAIAISWKRLAENNPDANLRFASMEVKGEDNLLLKLKTAPNANFSQLNATFG